MAVEAERWAIPVAPAGAAWSNVDDMARVVAVELGSGELLGKQFVSEQQLLARRTPQVKLSDEASYGLAWDLVTENGIDTVSHTGGTLGFSSLLFLIPEHRVAIVLLSNAGDRGAFIYTVHRRFLELLFDGKPTAREELVTQVRSEAEARAEELQLFSRADPAWFDTLAGAWVAPGLGRIDLARDERGATLDAGEWRATVGKRTIRDGTVAVVTTSLPAGISLVPRARDGRTILVLSERQHEYVFERAQ